MSELKLEKIYRIDATLEAVTGIHIGSSNSEMHIGGIDSPVIKHPHTDEPYLPGSSLKGKIRSLLEWRFGLVGGNKGNPVSARYLHEVREGTEQHASAWAIARLFGVSGDANEAFVNELGPTRVSFWDANLCSEWRQLRRDNIELLTEEKMENCINRISGVADNPRSIERVPAGSPFQLTITLKKLSVDSDALLTLLLQGLKLLELDGLGGSGSRGYGKVVLKNICLDGEDISERYQQVEPFAQVQL
ncbi:type III-A CRISPR-associated RAMP protein Csm3 [Shewanella sp. 4t3-1-2LB]|jgi:CRISPR-associated protein Csm3|uniref:type III-A CRISPR-associated RAMP protein Csm3 n=1 Tax=Shewanella sp. 4t3-1-2LB TaxID=2817682 RepID=UPI001A995DE6|nr:type III-A CRISPR-associated RAMP protein Csm3 [Shewanella sp. 4t3-1-2LB]MBO1270821.1 type III-A CRISPR-associated RAMP protein Csm3 [Shewanella sp. 4t3-1-2LB]